MTVLRRAARLLLAALFALALLADYLAPALYDRQFRQAAGSGPGAGFPIGADELGRDRLSRLVHGARVSLLLAPAAAVLATLLAGVAGALAGLRGGWCDRVVVSAADLFQSLPWMFLLLAARALLPLNVPPAASVMVTFALLGVLSWAGPARVVRAGARALGRSDFLLSARATGISSGRILLRCLLPNLRPVLQAQFWVAVPLFILGEANLSILGLGVQEPLPSLGSLLKEMENYDALAANPWIAAPAALLMVVVGCLHLAFPREETLS